MTSILYFSSQFPTPAAPHMGMFSVQRIRALRNAGCEVTVVCPVIITLPLHFWVNPAKLYRWVREQLRLPSAACIQGINVHYPKWFWFPKGLLGWYTSYFLYRQVFKSVSELVKEVQPDVILSSWLPDGVAAAKLGEVLGIPTIAIADGSDVNRLSHSYLGWSYACRCLNQESSTIVFVSQALKARGNALGLHGENNKVLYNAVDIELFRPGLALPEDRIFTILGVGRLVPVKGFDVLLTAFARLYQALDEQARLILVGEGPLLKTLTQKAADLGILDAVDFVGAVNHEQVVQYFQQAHVFCLPSYSEGSPSVLVEAMACGKPVVASDVGGIGEIVNARSGILVPPGNPDRLCEALLQARDRVWNEKAIRQETENHYEWGKWTDEILGLIHPSHLEVA